MRFSLRIAAVLAVVTVLAVGALAPTGRGAVAPGSTPTGGPAAARPAPSPAGTGMSPAAAQSLLAGIAQAHVPSRFVYLPNLDGREVRRGDVVTPLYDRSPAPMGVSDLGVRNTTGVAVPTLLTTPSFEGSMTFSNLSVFYLDNDAPDYVGLQLNTVLANVTLFGNSSYVFWNQNVVTWSARSHLLQFIDNVWNLSGPSGQISPNVFAASNGTLVAPSFYYALGPVLNVSLPFTLDLYTNASVASQGGLPYDSVWFNFTIVNGTGVHAGSFDHVVFNSQDLLAPSPTIPVPVYEVNGASPTPTGYLPYDAELVLCGPGGGSTTSVLTLNATMQLRFLNRSASTYDTVPTALGYGTDTGETIEGVSEYFDAGGTVHLGAGPSLLSPMWNASPSARPGAIDLTGTIAPATAFVFVNATDSFSADWAAWAPVPPGGQVDYRLPPGNYSGEILMSGYDPATFVVNGSSPSTWRLPGALVANASRGLYTPLIASGNAELAELAVGGNGTPSNPYLLPSGGVASLDPIFGQLNDFTFPVFPGLLLYQTTASVEANGLPTFEVVYAGSALGTILALSLLFGTPLPVTNDLQLELYGTSQVSVFASSGISGWFPPFLNGFPLANLMLWNTTGSLIGGNGFLNEGSSLLLFGGGHNVVWGNTFSGGPANATFPVFGTSEVDLSVFESNDTIYDNSFTAAPGFAASTRLAQSPAYTIYTETYYSGTAARYVDTWNVSSRPASSVNLVNGYALYGSIVGGRVQGGNFWSDYGTATNPLGVLPYNESGAIAIGGDYLPLLPPTPFTVPVTFTASGLPAGAAWSVDLNGVGAVSTSRSLVFDEPNGTYTYLVGPVAGLVASPGSGSFGVAGAPVVVGIAFAAPPVATFPLAFAEVGLAAGTNWSVAVGGVGQSALRDTISFDEPNGTYAFAVGVSAGYAAAAPTGNVTVAGGPVTVTVNFTAVGGTLVLTLTPVNATIAIDGLVQAPVNGTLTVIIAPGLHRLAASAPGYAPYFNNVSLAPGELLAVSVALVGAPAGPSSSPGPTGPYLALLIGVGTLATVFLIGMVYFATRRARPPSPPPAGAGGVRTAMPGPPGGGPAPASERPVAPTRS